ncbi:MAG: transcriptional repressor, partial [Campylobacterota bacterium]|nr:transcriptional repressor [Campylobacterota bacterium]
MIYISSKERMSIDKFRAVIYNYIKENRLKYSDQRERVLKILYSQSYPVSIDFLVKKLNETTKGIGYATVSRQIKFFQKLDMLEVVNKIPKGYLLKKNVDDSHIE